jgi:hypothetical protein
MTCLEWVAAFSDAALGAAALVTAGVAAFGLRSWRRELRGRTEYDLARRLLLAAYKVRDNIDHVRSPFIATAEFEGPTEVSGEPNDPSDRYSHVYRKRWERFVDALREFQTVAVEAEVFWGQVAADAEEALCSCAADLSIRLEFYLLNRDSVPKEQRLLRYGSDGDVFTERVSKAMGKVEQLAKQHLRR